MNNINVIDEREVLGFDFKVYGDADNPLFLAKDVAKWIEHSNPTEMVKNIDEDEKLNSTIFSGGQKREMTFLTEDGLYEVTERIHLYKRIIKLNKIKSIADGETID